MAAAKQFAFTFKELAELMVRDAKVKSGHWGVFVKFGIQGTNSGTSAEDLKPTAIVPILELGLQEFDSPNGLTVDASKIQKADAE